MSIENAKILEKGKKAYIKKKAEKKKAEDFGPRLKGWKFWSKKDKDTVIEIIEKNNKKRKGRIRPPAPMPEISTAGVWAIPIPDYVNSINYQEG